VKLTIIIPLFNEKNSIIKLLNLIENEIKINKQIIIVNDCSKDSSLELINNYQFLSDHLILNHKSNLGKGACIKTAKKYVKGDIVIIQDADLEYNPKDYHQLTKPIIDGEVNVVYGSRVLGKKRYQNNNFISLIRIFINHFLTIISNLINNQNLTDAHTCYKVCTKIVFEKIDLVENDFAFCPEFTSKISSLKEKILEVPISYSGRTYEQGKKIKSIDGVKAIIALLKYGFFFKKK
jgi:glycosyltransferase involved in cell wall biosynthesis